MCLEMQLTIRGAEPGLSAFVAQLACNVLAASLGRAFSINAGFICRLHRPTLLRCVTRAADASTHTRSGKQRETYQSPGQFGNELPKITKNKSTFLGVLRAF